MGLSTALLAKDGRTILAVTGELDATTAQQLHETIDRLVRTGRGHLEVDLSRVGRLESAAIEVLITGRRQANELAKTYRVTGTHDTVRYVLNAAGVLDYLTQDNSNQHDLSTPLTFSRRSDVDPSAR